ncbi:MAG TPA: ABC transporter permease [Ktedonobacteraceae bacterium]
MSMTASSEEQKQPSPQTSRSSTLPSSLNIQAKRRQRRQAFFIHGGRIFLLVVLLVVWQSISGRLVNPLFISSPLGVVTQAIAWVQDGSLWYHTEITLQETLLGLFFGVISGIVLALLLGPQQVLGEILDPFIVAIYSIPKVALAPLFLLWFGIDLQMKVILAAVTVFFLVFFNTLAGVRNVDQNLIDAVRLMGGKPRDIMFKVIIPSASGYMLVGLHIAIPYALIGAVIAELVASNRGLGYLIDASAAEYNTSGVFVALLVLTLIAGILNAIVGFIDRKTSQWKAVMRTGNQQTL